MSLVAETVHNDDLVDPAARPTINSGAERDSSTHPRPNSRCPPGQCGDDTGLHSGIGAGAKTTQDGSNAIKMAGKNDVECCVTGTPGSATPGISRRREETARCLADGLASLSTDQPDGLQMIPSPRQLAAGRVSH